MVEGQARGWTAYADGSCMGNPGPGGWGVILIDPDQETTELQGADPATTNNRMEITAAIEALRRTPASAQVVVRSDSQYVIKTMTLGWKRRENLDLWKMLDAEAALRQVRWEWVRGHNGDRLNERADELARSAAERRPSRPPLRSFGNLIGTAQPLVLGKESAIGSDPAAHLASLLRPGEAIRTCAHCRRDFVSLNDERCCSMVECQSYARKDTSLKRSRGTYPRDLR